MRRKHLVAIGMGLSVLAAQAASAPSTPAKSPPPPLPTAAPAPAPAAIPTIVRSRLPGFAATLSGMAVVKRPGDWKTRSYEQAWKALAQSNAGNRQQARWDYARSLIGMGRAAEALGVLNVMRQDDPDLALVPAYRLALGATFVQLRRLPAATDMLTSDGLKSNPEACAWRLRAYAEAGLANAALPQLKCAVPALNARRGNARIAFLIPLAQVALDLHRPDLALQWLNALPDGAPAANLYRGMAYLARGDQPAARMRLGRARRDGNDEQRIAVELSELEAAVVGKSIAPKKALAALAHICLVWRGGSIEQRALLLSYRLHSQARDLPGALAAGATLFRYFEPGVSVAPLLAQLQASLVAALAPGSGLPLEQAAGLYWNYRDLSPTGAEGDFLVSSLGDRLQMAGLYERAAQLLEHQLMERARDLTQGPLSVKVATLFILAGEPHKALAAIKNTDTNIYPDDMLWDRHRIEAVALQQMGRTQEALLVLQDVPDGPSISAEIYWRQRDWTSLAATGGSSLPAKGIADDVQQAAILRYAIALAMLGREAEIARLRLRYSADFAKLRSAATFDLLTSPVGTIDAATIGKAMIDIPSASPAGRIADLLDAAPAVAPTPAA